MESQIIEKSPGANKPKALHRIAKHWHKTTKWKWKS